VCKKPGCGGAVKRLFSPGAGFLFKGSGFYSTDYRSEAYKKQAKSDTAQPAAGSKPADTGKKNPENKSTGDKPAA
jgi:hypothetical protein